MEAIATPSPSSYSYRNNTNNNNRHPSASKPPVFQIRFPLRSPKQDVHIINDKTETSKTTGLPQNDVTESSRSWRKNNKKTAAATTTTSDVLRLMDSLGLRIPPDIYASLIRECTLTADSTRAAELHHHISRSGLRAPLSLLNRLLLMNVSCGLLDTARQLFDRMTLKNFISWATMIVGYANDAHYDEAISLFVKMQDQFTMLEFPTWIIVCVLEACVCTSSMGLGKQIHGCLHKLGVANRDLFLTSSLIDFYGKMKCREGADFVFNQLSTHNTMTWTARIICSCREEHFRDVFSYFKEMGRAGIKKSTFTFSSVLRACGRIDQDDGNCGRQVHANAIKLGLDRDAFVQCGLVDMYGRSGLLRDAKLVFEMVDDKRNVACWNAMAAGYMRNGFNIEAIKFLYRMKAAGVLPPESLINEVRIACGNDKVERNVFQ
ncbi:pentatricopeptide repeat-containing protein At1g31790 [Alnus glutinosa]|uniref:pentatricopeptide repeat-containing protein At1g31790 n=1 Tax=Alnus glutinosa TaxID=3517 RepID=UPI002D79A817|nr:pentatricopeptide repeat-containing protein At1g31790 [Alnus glutinosa]